MHIEEYLYRFNPMDEDQVDELAGKIRVYAYIMCAVGFLLGMITGATIMRVI